jgi:hypothetical protein
MEDALMARAASVEGVVDDVAMLHVVQVDDYETARESTGDLGCLGA